MTLYQIDTYAFGIALIAVMAGFGFGWMWWRDHGRLIAASKEIERHRGWGQHWQQVAWDLHNAANRQRLIRSHRARHARQCQLQQQRAKVLARAAEMRGEG